MLSSRWFSSWAFASASNTVVLLVLLASLGAIGSDPQIALINVLMVVGLYVFVGQSGIFSFGHVAFVAIGAYTTAILTIPPATKTLLFDAMPAWIAGLHEPDIVAVLVGALVAGVAALVSGLVLMRLSGLAASLGTFALLVIVHVVVQNLNQVTNGQSGMPAVPTDGSTTEIVLWSVVVLGGVAALTATPAALRLRAAREDEVAAHSVGVRVFRERCVFWSVSGVVCGLAGGLHARYTGSVSPSSFYLDLTFLMIAMLIVGGSRSLSGAVLGASALAFLSELFRRAGSGLVLGPVVVPEIPALAPLLLAVVMLVVLLLRPSGITGGNELTLMGVKEWLRRGRGALAKRLRGARQQRQAEMSQIALSHNHQVEDPCEEE